MKMDGSKMGLIAKNFNRSKFFDELGDIYDNEIEFLISQTDEMIVKSNCRKTIKLKLNGKIIEQVSMYIYEFYGRGKIRGELIDDVDITEYLKNKFELVDLYFAYQEIIFRCHIFESNKEKSENYFLIAFHEVTSFNIEKD